MIKRRALEAKLPCKISNHSFCGTGITEYLRNGNDLEIAAQIAGHELTRTTQPYNHVYEELSARRDRTNLYLKSLLVNC